MLSTHAQHERQLVLWLLCKEALALQLPPTSTLLPLPHSELQATCELHATCDAVPAGSQAQGRTTQPKRKQQGEPTHCAFCTAFSSCLSWKYLRISFAR
jgi:hypothetical protein